MIEPITILIDRSINASTFPSLWKKANVVPIFKKDNRSIVSNYRPIFLLACTSKIVERQIYNQLYDFCLSNNLLSRKNSGFKKADGTINQLINLTDKIYKGLNNEDEIAIIFLDLSKAFDRVCHKKATIQTQKNRDPGHTTSVDRFIFVGQKSKSCLCWENVRKSGYICLITPGFHSVPVTLPYIHKRH